MVRLTRERLSIDELSACDSRDGAVCLFVGVVRDHNNGRTVSGLEYEAYEEMALPLMEEIAAEARTRFAISDVRMVHRLGRLEIGDAAVVVSVTAPHRAAAFEACRFAIDTLKAKVPIWKKEHYVDDPASWIEAPPPVAKAGSPND